MAGCGVCIFPCLHVCSHISDFVLLMCMHNEASEGEHPERERDGETEIKRNRVRS